MEVPSLALVVAVSLIRTKTSYRRLHKTYFAFFTTVGTLSLWLAPKPQGYPRFSFIDALYNSVSAITVTGLGSVEMHRFATSDFVTLIFLMILGSQVFTSAIPLFIRRLIHNPNPAALAAAVKRANSASSLTSNNPVVAGAEIQLQNPANGTAAGYKDRQTADDQQFEQSVKIMSSPDHSAAAFSTTAVKRGVSMPVMPTLKSAGAGKIGKSQSLRITPLQEISTLLQESNAGIQKQHKDSPLERLRSQLTLSRPQSQVNVLIDVLKEQDRLRKEASALKTLCWLVVGYWVTTEAVGFVVMEACVMSSRRATSLLKERGVNRSFFSFFATVSSLANAGYVPLDDSLVGFNRNEPFLLWIMALILIGNTLYAPMLRLIIWALLKATGGRRRSSGSGSGDGFVQFRQSLQYLLDTPRSCYTHLFPRTETLWLLLTVAIFNGVQIAVICGLDWNSGVFDGLSNGQKFVNAMFSSVTTRNAGLNAVNTAAFSAGSLVLAAGMMYVAAYPIYLSRQHSKEPTVQDDGSITNPSGDIYKQSRKLFARDSVYLFITILIVCITERKAIRDDPLNFSVFNIIFEIISGYGNVGLSLGYNCSLKLSGASSCTDVSYSFSGKWSVVGKLIIVIVMLLGRHRGLPEDVDWAIAPPIYQ